MTWGTSLQLRRHAQSSQALSSISGLVVEYIVPIDVIRARFPADAGKSRLLVTQGSCEGRTDGGSGARGILQHTHAPTYKRAHAGAETMAPESTNADQHTHTHTDTPQTHQHPHTAGRNGTDTPT